MRHTKAEASGDEHARSCTDDRRPRRGRGPSPPAAPARPRRARRPDAEPDRGRLRAQRPQAARGRRPAERLTEIAAELAGAERSFRDLITTLENSGKDDLESLADIAAAEIARFRRGRTVEVELITPADAYPDSHSQEIAIRSILREALTNVGKHAQASAVRVEITASATGIRLEVEDDGRGFDPVAVGIDRIGLTSMRDRLQFLGGSLAIVSRPGGPTIVTAMLRRWQHA